jgi:hypothetical protein
VLLATRLPKLWMPASAPKLEPRRSSAASVATAEGSAVSTAPMATPAAMKQAARMGMLASVKAKPVYASANAATPPASTSVGVRRSASRPAGTLVRLAATL